MKKKNWIVTVLFVAFVGLMAFTFKTPAPPGDWKNLKVLPQDISKEKLDSVMDVFKNSLGVKCSFCHSRWADTTKKGLDFASDAKEEKDITRYMMKMTASINETFFNPDHSTRPDTLHAVICYTCHRDFPAPDSKKLMEELDMMKQQQMQQWQQQQKQQQPKK